MLQGLNDGLEGLSAHLEILECIEACTGRGEENAVSALCCRGAKANGSLKVTVLKKGDARCLEIGMREDSGLYLLKGSACQHNGLYISAGGESICKRLKGDIFVISAADDVDGAGKSRDRCRRSCGG